MKLSVIIVNYNVKYFLEQALLSVRHAVERMGVPAEIIVVDNESQDGSVEMVRRKFPDVRLIVNAENVGFAVANNQGIRESTGEYVLLLNPDTVVEEDTFAKTIAYMDADPKAGALGVKMIDGKGNFLAESKRGFPSPMVAFYKAFGLSALFPRSRRFGGYHLGYLDEDDVNKVDVLAGAFMLIRREVLDRIGLLDEAFFMYGEDIDLSYRIVEAGWHNVYFPKTRIIHYKGESTKKGSLNYVRMFYAAMKIFARKHFSGGSASVYVALINLAIYLRATLALFRRFIEIAWLPLLDAALIYGGMYAIKNFWEENIKWLEGVQYPPEYLYINVPLYIVLWLGAVWISGGYDPGSRIGRVVRGLFIGTLLIAAVYGFLEEGLRFSRGMILSGAAWAVFATVGLRLLLHFAHRRNLRFGDPGETRIVIAGGEAEAQRVQGLLNQFEVEANFIGFVSPESDNDGDWRDERVLGDASELEDIVEVFDVDEIIFCGKDLPATDIIGWMTRLGPNLDYKIVPREALSIIGSNSRNTAGDLYAVDLHLRIAEPASRRNKRLLDMLFALGLILSFPVQALIVRRPIGLLRNAFAVLFGRKTWVGYTDVKSGDPAGSAIAPVSAQPSLNGLTGKLPELRPGVLSPLDALDRQARRRDTPNSGESSAGDQAGNRDGLPAKTLSRLNLLYARDYSSESDLQVIWKGWRKLGGTALVALLLLVTQTLSAQPNSGVSSRNGFWMPNQDTLRIFLVFAEAVDDPDDTYTINPNGNWQRGRMPANADEYFDHAFTRPEKLKSRITKFFYQASFGTYILLGDYYPELVRIPYSELSRYGDEAVLKVLENLPGEDLVTAHGYRINGGDFDSWTMPVGHGTPKVKGADGYIDFLMIVWRVNSRVSRSENGGSVNTNKWKQPFKGKDGFMDRSRFVTKYSSGDGILQHEFSHSLYGGNNFHTGGRGAGNSTFIAAMGGYSNLSSYGSISGTWNGWDRHRMGWKPADKRWHISAQCPGTRSEVHTDLVYGAAPEGCMTGDEGAFIVDLQDFVTTGDALRIELPHLRHENPEIRRQYLWLENHQLLPGSIDHNPKSTPGVYAFIQVGRDDTSHFRGTGNFTAPLHPLGHFDYRPDFEQKAIYIESSKPNPLTGFHLAMIPAYNRVEPNEIKQGNETVAVRDAIFRSETFYVEKVYYDGVALPESDFNFRTHPSLGTVYDAFTPGRVLSMSANPAPVPLPTWEVRYPNRIPYEEPQSDDNRTTWLNGLEIKLLEQRADGSMRIAVRYDAYDVDGSLRWCGRIGLVETLRLEPRTQLRLDLGGSPTKAVHPIRHNGEAHFVDTTRLILYPGSELVLEERARIVIDNLSSLEGRPGSRLYMGPDSRIMIRSNTRLDLRGTQLEMAEGACIEVYGKGTLLMDAEVAVVAQKGAMIRAKGGAVVRLGKPAEEYEGIQFKLPKTRSEKPKREK